MNTDTRILSITAFAFFISGIVIPFVFGSDAAIIFAMVATVLALILGALSRSFLLGKVAAVGAVIVCIIGTINYIRFSRQGDSVRRDMEARLRMERQAEEARKH